MNMNFMQKADTQKKKDQRQQDEHASKIKDTSEWELPNLKHILRVVSRRPRVECVGYGNIMSDANYFASNRRRSWGGSLQVEEVTSDNLELSSGGDSKPKINKRKETGKLHDLSSLWRKRKIDDSENGLSGKKRSHRS